MTIEMTKAEANALYAFILKEAGNAAASNRVHAALDKFEAALNREGVETRSGSLRIVGGEAI